MCHGNHPGGECGHTKRHASTQEVNLEEAPVSKKARKEEPDDYREQHDQPQAARSSVTLTEAMPVARSAETASSDVRVIDFVDDDSIMQDMLHDLMQDRFERRGNRLEPEPPRLVAKVCDEEGRGELWLGPLPTESRIGQIMLTEHNIQVYCFMKDPEEVEVIAGGEVGMRIPGALVFRCEMSNLNTRGSDMRSLLPCLINSLRQGDNAYVHCVSGLSRAPMAAAVMSAKLMCISLRGAKHIIGQIRNVKFDGYRGSERDLEGPWIEGILRSTTAEAVAPTGFSCCVTRESQGIVHATASGEDGTGPSCRWKKGTASRRNFKATVVTVGSLKDAAAQFGGRFCAICEPLLRASLRVKIKQLW